MQWSWVGILAGMALRERQCTLKKEARYVNAQGNVYWKGRAQGGKVDTGGVKFFN